MARDETRRLTDRPGAATAPKAAMSDASVLLLFLVVAVLWALWWLLEDRFHAASRATVVGVLCHAGMVLLVVWMIAALRQGAAGP